MAFEDFFDDVKFDYDIEKKKFIDNMNYLQTMSVQEQTLYKKWLEFNKDEGKPNPLIFNYFLGDNKINKEEILNPKGKND